MKNRSFLMAVAAALAIVVASWMSTATALEDTPGAREEDAVRAAVDRVAPSVVRIQTVGGMETVDGVLQGSGPSTGLIISADGYIVSSAYNFARRPTAILVTLGKRGNIPAKLVAADHSRALVLLKIDPVPEDGELVVPEPAPASEVRPGAWAIAVGRTLDEKGPNISVGIVSAVGRIWGKALQTDAKISPANYGGPLVDLRGRVLGVLVPMSPMAGGETAGAEWYDSGIGFAVPLADVQRVLPDLRKGKNLETGLMGVSLKGRDMFAAEPIIAACPPGSPAYEAGARPGDKIVAINGRSVVNQAQMRHQIGPLYAGDKVRLTVLRDKREVVLTFSLTDKLPPFEHPFLGILPLHGAADEPGVAIRYVYPDSPAAKAGIKAGDRLLEIESQPLANVAAARDALNTLAPEQKIALLVARGAEKLKLTANLGHLPTDIPGELPPARKAVADAKKPGSGKLTAGKTTDIKLPELTNKCFAYVPTQSAPPVAYGVLVWLGPGDVFDRERTLKQWQAMCDAQGLILLVPQPREGKRWQPDDIDFIVRALERLDKTYDVDADRIVAVGHQGGGAAALLLALTRPGLLSGAAACDAALPASVRPEPIEPTQRLALLLAHGPTGPAAESLAPQIARLRELKYPVTEMKLPQAGRFLNEAEQGELARWVDSLDRL
ncbi:MAG: PDZ domain-containing protein [Planctomycetia bacterium]|nr:PDZ domain-containing protein [Planctomycetia bacterium]